MGRGKEASKWTEASGPHRWWDVGVPGMAAAESARCRFRQQARNGPYAGEQYYSVRLFFRAAYTKLDFRSLPYQFPFPGYGPRRHRRGMIRGQALAACKPCKGLLSPCVSLAAVQVVLRATLEWVSHGGGVPWGPRSHG